MPSGIRYFLLPITFNVKTPTAQMPAINGPPIFKMAAFLPAACAMHASQRSSLTLRGISAPQVLHVLFLQMLMLPPSRMIRRLLSHWLPLRRPMAPPLRPFLQ